MWLGRVGGEGSSLMDSLRKRWNVSVFPSSSSSSISLPLCPFSLSQVTRWGWVGGGWRRGSDDNAERLTGCDARMRTCFQEETRKGWLILVSEKLHFPVSKSAVLPTRTKQNAAALLPQTWETDSCDRIRAKCQLFGFWKFDSSACFRSFLNTTGK